MRKFLAATACALAATSAGAQEEPWKFSVTTYLWTAGTEVTTETPSGDEVSAELSFADAFDALDFAFSGTFEARKGKLGFFTDGQYLNLTTSSSPSGPLADDVFIGSKLTIISAYGTYRIYEEQNVAIDLAGGFRWTKLDSDVRVRGGTVGDVDFSNDADWVDPVIGVRLGAALSERVSAALFVDYGGFDGDSSTWQAVATLGYALNERWTLRGGYRYMEWDREIDGRDVSMNMSGLILGATYNF
jgi:opacity protein-like surface antigen